MTNKSQIVTNLRHIQCIYLMPVMGLSLPMHKSKNTAWIKIKSFARRLVIIIFKLTGNSALRQTRTALYKCTCHLCFLQKKVIFYFLLRPIIHCIETPELLGIATSFWCAFCWPSHQSPPLSWQMCSFLALKNIPKSQHEGSKVVLWLKIVPILQKYIF